LQQCSIHALGTTRPYYPRQSTVASTVNNHAGDAGYPYPQDALNRFASSCERTGTHTACVCLYGSMEQHYSYQQFEALVAADNPNAPEYTIVAQDCAGK